MHRCIYQLANTDRDLDHAHRRACAFLVRSAAMAKMKWVKTTQPIDLSTWGLVDDPTDVLRDEFAKGPPDLSFPLEWAFGNDPSDGRGGPPPTDPAMLYVDLPLAASSDSICSYSCSLEDAIDDL